MLSMKDYATVRAEFEKVASELDARFGQRGYCEAKAAEVAEVCSISLLEAKKHCIRPFREAIKLGTPPETFGAWWNTWYSNRAK